MDSREDICPRPAKVKSSATAPLVPPIQLASVYACHDPQQADALLGGSGGGYVYARDGHPNADQLADKCGELHGAERCIVTASGMAALAAAALSQLAHGDHVVVANQLYGRSLALFTTELNRLGIASSVVDANDLNAVAAVMNDRTRMIVAETISNPLLRVADLTALAEIAHKQNAVLVADNTLAGPLICRPLEWGADFVVESITKSLNGHSDVILGLLAGKASLWQRVTAVVSTWGFASAPFDCWLALRGMETLALRIDRASANAMALAEYLAGRGDVVRQVHYPGLKGHPDHALANRQFAGRFGAMVSISLAGGRAAAERFIASASRIPFCPSLGELCTTLSHPESTSHRSLTSEARTALGIDGGMLRLSIGVESSEAVIAAIAEGLSGANKSSK